MPKVFGIHAIELRPGVQPEEFEQFWGAEMAAAPIYPGWKLSLLKGDRGERAGQYAVLFEIEDVATRDRYSPAPNQGSAEAEAFARQHPELAALFEKWATFSATDLGTHAHYTDYVLVQT